MIIREYTGKETLHPYGKYFLALEAPGDENPPRRNMKTVSVAPNQRARLDFTNDLMVPDEPEEEPDTEVPEDIELDDVPAVGDDDAEDDLSDIELPDAGQAQTPEADDADTDDPDTDVDIELPDVEGDGEDVTVDGTPTDPEDTEDFTMDPPPTGEGEGENPDDNTDYTQDTAPDAPENETPPGTGDDADNTDYTDTGNDSTDAGNTEGNQENSGNNEEKGPGLEYDSVRQYNLFKEFMKLRSSIDTYITKLESCISDDAESNLIIKNATSKFRDIYNLVTDYMMMKFELCTYVQNLLFFERQVATVNLVFKLLRTADDLYGKEKDRRSRSQKRPAGKSKRKQK